MKKNSDKTKRNAPSYFINEVRNYPEKNAKGRDVFGKLHHDNLVFSDTITAHKIYLKHISNVKKQNKNKKS